MENSSIGEERIVIDLDNLHLRDNHNCTELYIICGGNGSTYGCVDLEGSKRFLTSNEINSICHQCYNEQNICDIDDTLRMLRWYQSEEIEKEIYTDDGLNFIGKHEYDQLKNMDFDLEDYKKVKFEIRGMTQPYFMEMVKGNIEEIDELEELDM